MTLFLLTLLALAPAAPPAAAGEPAAARPRVALETSLGTMVVELFPEAAPRSVGAFLHYVRSGFYDGTIFHRVIPGFMVQGGGFTPGLQQKPFDVTVPNEADNGLSNRRGTLALARTMDPHSANAQFFVNLVDNGRLDHRAKTTDGWGYAVFGEVVAGMEVAAAIAAVPTVTRGPYQNVPAEPVRIERARELAPGEEVGGGEGEVVDEVEIPFDGDEG